MIKIEKIYDFILFCGDIHGKVDIIPNLIRDYGLKNCAILQCGDFGIGFETVERDRKWLEHLNKRLQFSNSDLYPIRGNHDRPSYFDGTVQLSNIMLLKDYSVININGISILGVGGAISVDRTDRVGYKEVEKVWGKRKKKKKLKPTYWADEIFVYDEEKISELRNIDIVFTHSAPNRCHPVRKKNIYKWAAIDDTLLDEITFERSQLTMMYEKLMENNDIKEWYYGHFHITDVSIENNTMFYALGINNMIETNLNK